MKYVVNEIVFGVVVLAAWVYLAVEVAGRLSVPALI
jgi:hypothetical protein